MTQEPHHLGMFSKVSQRWIAYIVIGAFAVLFLASFLYSLFLLVYDLVLLVKGTA